jgi:hypothetical protein
MNTLLSLEEGQTYRSSDKTRQKRKYSRRRSKTSNDYAISIHTSLAGSHAGDSLPSAVFLYAYVPAIEQR